MQKVWNFLLKLLKPFIVLAGKIHAPFSHKKITGVEYYKWRDLIEPGMVMLTSTYGEFSNLINPSSLSHGALYLGGRDVKYIIESIGKGVLSKDLITFMTSKDEFILIKPKFGTPEQHQKVCVEALKYEFLPYDYSFEANNKAFYCFELVIQAYNDVFPGKIFKHYEIVKGKRSYDSNTFLSDPENWEIVIDSRTYFNNKED